MPEEWNPQANLLRVEREVQRMSGEDVQRMRQLEQENSGLKRALADAMLDNQILKELNAKRW